MKAHMILVASSASWKGYWCPYWPSHVTRSDTGPHGYLAHVAINQIYAHVYDVVY